MPPRPLPKTTPPAPRPAQPGSPLDVVPSAPAATTAAAGTASGWRIPTRVAGVAHWLADSWLMDGSLLLVAAVVSLLASRFPADIFTHTSLTLRHIHWGVTAFWVLLLVGLLLLGVKRVAVWDARRERRVEVERLQSELRHLREGSDQMVASIVPVNMLSAFSFAHNGIHRGFVEALRDEAAALALTTPPAIPEDLADILRGYVRMVLSNVLAFVRDLEQSRDPGVVYAANVMRYYPVSQLDGLDGPKKQEVIARLRFCNGAKRRVKGLDGVLDLDNRLSTSTAFASRRPDGKLLSLAFPIPKRAKDEEGRYVVLPGAPLTFLELKTWGADADTMVERSRSAEWNLPPKVAGELEQYLLSEEGRHVQSLLCHPLALEEGKAAYGVLNIHSNRRGLLKDEARRDRFALLLRPTVLVLLDLLERLDAYERKARRRQLGTAGGTGV